MKNAKILIVDDNKSILSAINLLLRGQCAGIKTLSSPNQLLTTLGSDDFDVLLLDMNFSAGINSGNEGIYWLERVLELKPGISVVMITAYGDVELAVKAIRLGAVDFVLKPWDNDKLIATIHSAYRLCQSNKEVGRLRRKEQQLVNVINKSEFDIIGTSLVMKKTFEMVAKVAKTSANVLITGENGTGKELIAREIHRLSERANKVMVTVDMGAVTGSLFESELFGHKKGAFTDAQTDRTGKIETADGGTLFLDEIGNLPMPLQSKLLSVLQNRTITKVGDNKEIPVDIRLICATNANPEKMVADGTFREDLLFRINTIHIEVPPLRDRAGDIIELARFYLNKYRSKYNKPNLKLSEDAAIKLLEYQWPGNVRELQHAIEKSVILADHAVLTPDDFMFRTSSVVSGASYEGTLEDVELTLIRKAIEKYSGNLSIVASKLGITRQTLYNKIKKYGL